MPALKAKIMVAQTRPEPGNLRANVADMLEKIAKARRQGAQIVVFAELAPTGYLLGDRWEDESFIRDIAEANEEIRAATEGLVVVWGSIRADEARIGEDGRIRKYNAALIAQDGKWVSNGRLVGWIPKTNLPKYRIFDDARHFYPAYKLAAEMGVKLEDILRPFTVVIDDKEVALALAICEDLWEDEYANKVSQMYSAHKPDLLVDISSSPWTAQKWHAREAMLRKRAKDAGCPILYVNIVGLQNNAKNLIWFDGSSCLMGADGAIKWRSPRNKEGLFTVTNRAGAGFGNHSPGFVDYRPTPIEEKYDATIAAMRDFYAPYKRIVMGLSGGIDSAVSGAMHVLALGPEKVLAINMPMPFNSPTTRNLAKQCADNLGIEYRVMPIHWQYEARLDLLARGGYADVSSFDRENIQARIRGQVLADVCACEGTKLQGRCAFTNNGNKTEVALNYFTEYGDGAGTASFFGDYWKGEIYDLAAFINARAGKEMIPKGIIDIVPSAELSAEQNVDEGKGDPIFYPFHDKLLLSWIERRWDPTIVLQRLLKGTLEQDLGCAAGTISKYFPTKQSLVDSVEWAWLQYSYEGKRHKLPPTLVTSRRAFGFDRRDTIAGGYFTVEYYRLKAEVLAKAA